MNPKMAQTRITTDPNENFSIKRAASRVTSGFEADFRFRVAMVPPVVWDGVIIS